MVGTYSLKTQKDVENTMMQRITMLLNISIQQYYLEGYYE